MSFDVNLPYEFVYINEGFEFIQPVWGCKLKTQAQNPLFSFRELNLA